MRSRPTRRHLLASTLALTVAGCVTDSPGPSEEATTTTTDRETSTGAAATTTPDTDAETATESSTEERTTEPAQGVPALVIENEELVVDEGQDSTEAYVTADITNEGDVASGQVVVTTEWYDENGDILGNARAYLPTLGAGETWVARVDALLSDNSAIADFEFGAEYDEQPPEPPEGVAVVESSLQFGDGTVAVTGRVANDAEDALDYVEAIAILYDADGNVLDGDWTSETDVPAGATWQFTVDWFVYERVDAVDSHRVLLNEAL